MDRLPFEILNQIYDCLSTEEYCALATINKKLRYISMIKIYTAPKLVFENQLEGFLKISNTAKSFVQHLDLSSVNKIIDKLDGLECLSNLKSVNLSKCSMNELNTIVNLIKNNKNHLETLKLNDCYVSKEVLVNISKASRHRLTHVELAHTRFTPFVTFDVYCELEFLNDLETPSKIKHLDLSGSRWVVDKTLYNIVNSLTDLEHLNIEWCCRITLDSIISTVFQLKNLKSIDIRYIFMFKDIEEVRKLLFINPALKQVMITDRSMSRLTVE